MPRRSKVFDVKARPFTIINTHSQCLPMALYKAGIIDKRTFQKMYDDLYYTQPKEGNVEEACSNYKLYSYRLFRHEFNETTYIQMVNVIETFLENL